MPAVIINVKAEASQAHSELKKLDNEAQQIGSRKLNNPFDTLESGAKSALNSTHLLQGELRNLWSQIPIIGRLFNTATSDVFKFFNNSSSLIRRYENDLKRLEEKALATRVRIKNHLSDFSEGLNAKYGGKVDTAFLRQFRQTRDPVDKTEMLMSKGLSSDFTNEIERAALQFHKLERDGTTALNAIDAKALSTRQKLASLTTGVEESSFSWTKFLTVGGLVIALLAAIGLGLFELTKHVAEAENKMFSLSEKTGFTVTTLSALDIAASRNNSSVEKLSMGLGIFDKALAKAATGSDLTSRTIRKLNLDYRDNEKALSQMLNLLMKMPDDGNRTAIAQQVFGRGGKEILGVADEIKRAGGNLEDFKQKLLETGQLMTGDQARAGHQFTVQMQELSRAFQSIARNIASSLMPQFLDSLKELQHFLEDNNEDVVKGITFIGRAIDIFIIKPMEGWLLAFGKVEKAAQEVRRLLYPQEAATSDILNAVNKAASLHEKGTKGTDTDLDAGRQQETELQRLQKEYTKLTGDIASLQQVGSQEFRLRYKVEDLQRFKGDLEHILTLRHELGLPLQITLPATGLEAQKALANLERQKKLVDEVRRLTLAQADAEDKLAVAAIAAQLKVVDAYTRAETAYLEGIRKRKDAEQQLTADIAVEMRKRMEAQMNAQKEFDETQAQAVLDKIKEIDKARADAMRATIDTKLIGAKNPLDIFRNNPILLESQNLARNLTAPRTPVTERLDTANKILNQIEANTKHWSPEDAANLIKDALRQLTDPNHKPEVGGDLLSGIAGLNTPSSSPAGGRLVVAPEGTATDSGRSSRDYQAFAEVNQLRNTPETNPFKLDAETFQQVTDIAGRYVITINELLAATELLQERTKTSNGLLKEQAKIEFESRANNLKAATQEIIKQDEQAARRKVEITDAIELARQQEVLNRLNDPNSYEARAVLADDEVKSLTEKVNLTRELIVLRKNASEGFSDEQAKGFAEGERNLLAAREGMAKRAGELQYEIAHANEDAAERSRLAWLQAQRDIQKADEDAADSMIQSRVKIADQRVYHEQQANAKVLEFLAQQKSISDIAADTKISAMQTTFDYLDKGLNKVLGTGNKVVDMFKNLLSEIIKLEARQLFLKLFNPQQQSSQSAHASNKSGGIFDSIKNLFHLGGDSPQTTPPFAGGNIPGVGGGSQTGSIGGVIQNFRQHGFIGGLKNLLGFGSKAAPAAAGAGGMAGAAADPYFGLGAPPTMGGASSGGMLAHLGFLANPWVIAGIGAAIGGFFLFKHLFGDKTLKHLKDAIRQTYSIDVRDNNVLKQIKEIGKQGYGDVDKHIADVIAYEPVKEILANYAQTTGQKSSLVTDKQLSDPGFAQNQFVHRATGGPAYEGQPYIVGDKGPRQYWELFVPSQDGFILPSVPEPVKVPKPKAAQSSTSSAAGGSQGQSQSDRSDGRVAAVLSTLQQTIEDLTAQVSRLKTQKAGVVVADGLNENPRSVGPAILETQRSDPKFSERFMRNTGATKSG